MKGIEVKNILKKNGFVIKDIAQLMGETPQNLNSMLKADDIKTGVLERIAIAIKKNLYFFFDNIELQNSQQNDIIMSKEVFDKVSQLIDTVCSQQQTIAESVRIIDKMSSKFPAQMDEDAKCAAAQ